MPAKGIGGGGVNGGGSASVLGGALKAPEISNEQILQIKAPVSLAFCNFLFHLNHNSPDVLLGNNV